MDATSPVTVRGRCICGRRFRIRNARAGLGVPCPSCQRVIQLSEVDIRAALGAGDDPDRVLALMPDEAHLLEAIPVHHGARIRLAADGSTPGLTGQREYEHEEAQVVSALSRGSILTPSPTPRPGGRGFVSYSINDPPPVRPFAEDLLASFYFAGYWSNAASLLISALILSIPVVFFWSARPNAMLMFSGLLGVSGGLVGAYIVHFYWGVMECTVGGEDQIPWVSENFDLWEDVFKPSFWIVLISWECMLPAIIGMALSYHYSGNWLPDWAALALLALGWVFWPVAVMSISLGRSIVFLRPDWLVRCVIGIGPSYLVALAVIALTVAGWWSVGYARAQLHHLYFVVGPTWQTALMFAYMPLLAVLFTVNLYFGYVLFRTLGLLFRHFRTRFPWQM